MSEFIENLIFTEEFRKIIKYQISLNSAHLKPSFSVRRWQKNRHDVAYSRFRNFVKASKMNLK